MSDFIYKMKVLSVVFALFLSVFVFQSAEAGNNLPHLTQNNCVSFTVGAGTGCAWMCNYCAQQLGTTNYYFEDGVCQYQPTQGGCVGNPQSGVKYTCCSASVQTAEPVKKICQA